MSTSDKIGHGLAKVLGIKLDYRNETNQKLSRGESMYSVASADDFVEEEPRTIDWIREVIPGSKDLSRWAYGLFPFVHWIGRYNVQWLIGDLIAGKRSPTLNRNQLMVSRNHYRSCGRSSINGICCPRFAQT